MNLKLYNVVILAKDFDKLVNWYKKVFDISERFYMNEGYHYCEIGEKGNCILAFAKAEEMGLDEITDSRTNIIPQFIVQDIDKILELVESNDGEKLFGPSYDEKGKFTYAGFQDPENNQIWIIENRTDENEIRH